MTAAQRSVAAALCFLGGAALAGITLLETGVEYRVFGLPEGILGLLLVYLLRLRGVWDPVAGPVGWIAVAYGTLASAQLLELLLPPPGVVEWVVVVGLAVTLWGGLSGGSRQRLVAWVASLALLLSLLKFSVIPLLWERAGPAPGEAFGLGDLAEGFRRLFVDFQSTRPAGQLLGFLAICFWAAATRLLWPSDDQEEDWLESLPPRVRLRLLRGEWRPPAEVDG